MIVERLTSLLRRIVPGTLFGRLLLLLMVCVVASHMLALTLMFEIHGFGPTMRDGMRPLPARPPFQWAMLLDIGIRMTALIFAAWIGARWLTRPMKRLADAAQSLGDNVHGPEMSESGPRECRETTRVFNRMQSRLRQQLDERDQFVAAVSHDLRTPLTRLRLRVEDIDSPRMKQILGQDIREMDQMITTTLDYLRGEADEEKLVQVDLQSLAQSLADDESEHDHEVHVSGSARPMDLQPLAIRRAITNLMQNAICYGGSAFIHLSDTRNGVQIEVSDNGPGIPEAELESVLMPFYRVEKSRNRGSGGIGLGLSIVSGIARKHEGRLTLRNRPSGGLVATISLPRQPLQTRKLAA